MLIWILIQGYSGRIEAMGRWREDYFEHVGVCFEQPSNYRKLTALENLTFFAGFFSNPTRAPDALLERVGLADAAHKRVETFSKGMQIRLNLARTFLNEPKLLFLDEPTAGLDPRNAQSIRDLIREERARGATLFLTSHDMAIADELCDRFGFLVDGQLKSVDAPAALRRYAALRLERLKIGESRVRRVHSYSNTQT